MSYSVKIEAQVNKGRWAEVMDVGQHTYQDSPLFEWALDGLVEDGLFGLNEMGCRRLSPLLEKALARLQSEGKGLPWFDRAGGHSDWQTATSFMEIIHYACRTHLYCRLWVF